MAPLKKPPHVRKPVDGNRSPSELLESACRREGMPVTVQRRAIFSTVLERRDHPTVDQVFAQVKDRIPGVSRTTVYRTLETLVKIGLIRRTHHFAASVRFDGNMEQHHHLVCTGCGKVIDFQDSRVTLAVPAETRRDGFTLLDYSVYFEGVCSACERPPHSAKSRKPNPQRGS